jgi:hypothetical protein
MAMRDIIKLLEALAKAGKDVSPDAVRAILAKAGPGKAGSSEVMTSVGPDNARAYSAILSGKESMAVGGAAISQGLATILPSDPARQSASQPVIPLLSQPVIPIQDVAPTDLRGRSVAQDVKGLTWAERRERLESAGRLLTADEVAARTLKRKPSQRDIIRESERQEQRDRDREAAAAEAARSKPVLPFAPEAPPVLPQPAQQTQKIEQNKLLEALKRLTEAVKEANRPRRTVAQDIAGLSWGERWKRLEGTGRLLSEEDVKEAPLRERVSNRDIVVESERREQEARNREEAARHRSGWLGRMAHYARAFAGTGGRAAGGAAAAGAGAGGAGAGGAGAMGGVAARLAGVAGNPYVLAAGAVVAVGVAMAKLPGIARRLGESLVEAQRPLAMFSAAIAGTVARMDYQQRVLDMQQAQATGGSASLLGSSLMQLRNDMQPMREAMTTVKNLLATGLVQFGRYIIKAASWIPGIKEIGETLKNIEKKLGGGEANRALNDHLRAIASGAWLEPKNRKPAARRPDRDRDKED